MKTLAELKQQAENLNNQIAELERIASFGVNKTQVHAFVKPQGNSHYSMGEVTELYCNGELVCKNDKTCNYAKSCTWKAKHGLVVIECNKKELKEYSLMCDQLEDTNIRIEGVRFIYENQPQELVTRTKHLFEKKYNIEAQMADWCTKHTNLEKSVYNKKITF